MRPINLVISGFCSYAGMCEIDFTLLGKSGIYLITGPTGAGKTTIFDAITYALFGNPSGSTRDESTFRSKYATPDMPTMVQLTFEHQGREYMVRRNPEYVRIRKNGKGEKKEAQSAELHCWDGRIVTKKNEVNAAIAEILGINRDQFTQTTMIAQGDFLRVLLASTDDKKKILRKIFATSNYAALEEELRSRALLLRDEWEKACNSMVQQAEGIICGADNPLSARLNEANAFLPDSEKTLAVLSEIISADEISLQQEEKALSETDDDIAFRDKRLQIAQEQSRLKKSLADSLLLYSREDQRLIKLQLEKEQAESKKPRFDMITGEIARLNSQLPEYAFLTKYTGEMEKSASDAKSFAESLKQNQEQAEQLRKELAEKKQELTGLESSLSDKVRLENSLAELQRQKDALSQLQKDAESLKKLAEKLRKAQEDLKDAYAASQMKKAGYEKIYAAYLSSQAGLLAEELRDGYPCPVCGSMTHPNIAPMPDFAPKKADLDSAKRSAEFAEKQSSQSSEAAGALKAQYDEKSAALLKNANLLFYAEDTDMAVAALSREMQQNTDSSSQVSAQLEEANRQIKRLQYLRKDVPELEQRLDRLITAQGEIERRHTAAVRDKENAEGKIQDLRHRLDLSSFATEEEITRHIDGLSREQSEITAEIDNVTRLFSESEKEKNRLLGSVQEAKKQLEGSEEIDAAAEQMLRKDLAEKKQLLQKSITALHTALSVNRAIMEKITVFSRESSSKMQEYITAKTLSDTANGTLSGKEKVTLETYILTVFYDRVIAKANLRFNVMTDGQYELVRKTDDAGKRSQTGLDLNIIDHVNGTERTVKSLSGGESFKASLSLALGLSDEIQSSAGGIELDTMFVDEGFGSLDEDSLTQALNALSGLTEGGRLVGIISHVAELEQKIDKQIVVTKDDSGCSHAKVIV